ncbi:hypothetical protein CB1_001033032 [Camelus ferus]|nr:hypothetical protein CB1_001033032 [Camelus ferus]
MHPSLGAGPQGSLSGTQLLPPASWEPPAPGRALPVSSEGRPRVRVGAAGGPGDLSADPLDAAVAVFGMFPYLLPSLEGLRTGVTEPPISSTQERWRAYPGLRLAEGKVMRTAHVSSEGNERRTVVEE